jgi:hypothetical protein
MASSRSWKAYRPTYRAREMQTLADWVWAGQSGSVIGLAGAGKSNLLGFLCHRPEVFQSYLPPQADPVVLIPVDLNNLPSNTLSTFYRVILRSFYEVRDRFDQPLQQAAANVYLENRATRDPFLAQSAMRELLLQFQIHQMRVVLVMDRFDKFGQTATSQMLDTLRGLRDSFKDIVCYIVGMRQEMVYLFDPDALGEMYEILDTHICWVGPMSETDARRLIAEETLTISTPLDEVETAHLLTLTGGYPALLKAVCHWWSSISPKNHPPTREWADVLLAERSVQSRMKEIWAGLTQEERRALAEVQKWSARAGAWGQDEERHYRHALTNLANKGLCQRMDAGWRIFSRLFATYVADVAGESNGKIWLDETTDELYHGQNLLEGLSPLERAVLHFFVRHPHARHTKTDLIVSAWPDELRRQGVTDDSLYQVIRELRKKIEPNPAKPCYIVTWRGWPEGGYQLFPEGRPG